MSARLMRYGYLCTLVCCIYVTGFLPPAKAIDTEPIPRARFFAEATLDEELFKAFDESPGSSQRVMVGLNTPYTQEYLLTPSGIASQRAQIAADQDKVLTELDLVSAARRKFQTIPGMALELDEAQLIALANHPLIEYAVLEVPETTQLTATPGIIGADAMWASSPAITGKGHTVAILDTGIDINHGMFSDGDGGTRVVEGACFSSNVSNPPRFTAAVSCPDGGAEEFGVAAGVACAAGVDGCDHGTHVAGIAAGGALDIGDGKSVSGIAPGANIVSVQVFSVITGVNACAPLNSPCAQTFQSDQIAGLEYVQSLDIESGGDYDIASINMSLGGGQFPTACDNDFTVRPRAQVINNLRAQNNIAVVIASGNNGFSQNVSAPACIANAISVGATTDTDLMADFSNYAPGLVDMFAPGVDVLSAVPGAGDPLDAFNGTSMAAPHVAGAWALLRQATARDAPVAEIEAALANPKWTASVSQRQNGQVIEGAPGRINIPASADELTGGIKHTVLAALGGLGNGTINVAGVRECFTDCEAVVEPGSDLALTALARPGSEFVSWTGCDSVFGNTCGLGTIKADTMVVANFALVPPDNDAQADATSFGSFAAFEHNQSTENATTELGEGVPSCDIDASNSVWFRWTPPVELAGRRVTVGSIGSDYDVVLDVFSESQINGLTELDCGIGTEAGLYRDARATFTPFFTNQYLIRATGYRGMTGQLFLTLDATLPVPEITRLEPGNESLTATLTVSGAWTDNVAGYAVRCEGGGATVTATGTGPSVTVEGLENDVSYACTAVSLDVTDAESAASTAVAATPEYTANGLPVWLLKEASDRGL